MKRIPTNVLVEMSLTIALAAVLGALALFQMPQGGSVSLAMLPLIVFALRRGFVLGLVVAVAYGMVDLMINPMIFYPVQVLLDYPLAYGAVGLAGLLHPAWVRAVERGATTAIWSVILPATAIAAFGRYVFHVISGVVFFGEYAPEGQPVLVYSAVYNLFVLVSAVGVFVAAAVVLPALSRILDNTRNREVVT